MGQFIGIIVYCVIGYHVVPWAHGIETASGFIKAGLKRLQVRGPYFGKGGATLVTLIFVFFPDGQQRRRSYGRGPGRRGA